MKYHTKFSELLTIVMPVYERYNFFEEALDSALSQKIQCKVIVVDNGSSHDEFRNIISKKNLPLSRLEFIKNNANLGMFANWNKSASYSKTEYTFIFGDDDVLSESFVELFLEAIESHPTIDLYCSGFLFLHKDKIVLQDWLEKKKGLTSLFDIKKYAAMYGLGVPTISTIYKTDILKQNPFKEHPLASMDWLMVYELENDCHIYVDRKISVAYRKHETANTSNREVVLSCFVSHVYIYFQIEKQCRLKNDYLSLFFAFLRRWSAIIWLAVRETNYFVRYHQAHSNFLADHIRQYSLLLYFSSSKFSLIVLPCLDLLRKFIQVPFRYFKHRSKIIDLGSDSTFHDAMNYARKSYF